MSLRKYSAWHQGGPLGKVNVALFDYHLDVVQEVVGDLWREKQQNGRRYSAQFSTGKLAAALTAGAAAACLAEAMIAKVG